MLFLNISIVYHLLDLYLFCDLFSPHNAVSDLERTNMKNKSILVVSSWTKFMTMTELMPLLRKLNRAKKLHVMHCLVSDLAQDESDLLRKDMSCPILYGRPMMPLKQQTPC